MKRHKQTEEEKQVTIRHLGDRTPLVTTKEDLSAEESGPMLPENDAFNDVPNEYNEQPGSGSLIGGRRGEQEYGVGGPAVDNERHDPFASAGTPEPGDTGRDTLPESEPEPYGELDKGFGGVSEYSSENAEEEEERIQEAECRSAKESEIDREDRDVLVRLALRLKERRDIDLSEVQLKIQNGAVTISGRVESAAEKTEIREVAEAIPGVRVVEDRLQVGAVR